MNDKVQNSVNTVQKLTYLPDGLQEGAILSEQGWLHICKVAS